MNEGLGNHFNRAPIAASHKEESTGFSEGQGATLAAGEFAAAMGLDQGKTMQEIAFTSPGSEGRMKVVGRLFRKAASERPYVPGDAIHYQKLVVGALGLGYTAILPWPGNTFDPNLHNDSSTAIKQWDPVTGKALEPKIFKVLMPGISGPEGTSVKSEISTSSNSASSLDRARENTV
ncbi:MAG: hypothetical protein AB203_02150 [Parcubacteria bacterium C7867-008]|nr:MAG: hypothetical protein AB203_02150 [Parcubacteria bacterium C7867-008]